MSKIRTILIALSLTLGYSAAHAQLTFWNDLYVYYPFNGNTLDYSGNELHAQGTDVSSAEGVFGDAGGSYRYNGLTSKVVRNVITLPDSFTLSGWYYSEADSQVASLIYNGNTGSSGYGIFAKKPFGSWINGYYGKTLIIHQGGVSQNAFNNLYELPPYQWLHIALVRKGDIFEIYLNGIFQTSGPVVCNDPTGEFSIGSSTEHIQSGYPSFVGRADEIMVFRAALSPQNVFKVYQSNITANSQITSLGTEISLSPNPVENRVVKIDCGKLNVHSVEIFDLKGQSVKHLAFNSGLEQNQKTLDLTDIQPGLYTALIQTDGKSVSRKIVLK